MATRSSLLLLPLLVLLLAACACGELTPWRGEQVFRHTVGPYVRRSNNRLIADGQLAPRPSGDILVTGYEERVLEMTEAGELVPVIFDRNQGVYFHHSVMHHEDPDRGQLWDRSSIHLAPFLFPQSPEAIGKPIHFSYGYGYRMNASTPNLAVCAHIKNWSGRRLEYYIEYTMTYREWREGDHAMVYERMGNDLQPGNVPGNVGVSLEEPIAQMVFYGYTERGHGDAKLVANMWHAHHGVLEAQLLRVRTHGAEFRDAFELLEVGEVLEIIDSSSLTYTNTIQYHEISYKLVDVLESDYLVVNATIDLDIVWQEKQAGEWFMLFNHVFLAYSDQWVGRRSEPNEHQQNQFGTMPEFRTRPRQ